jgi:hypothetical protein
MANVQGMVAACAWLVLAASMMWTAMTGIDAIGRVSVVTSGFFSVFIGRSVVQAVTTAPFAGHTRRRRALARASNQRCPATPAALARHPRPLEPGCGRVFRYGVLKVVVAADAYPRRLSACRIRE